MRTLSPSRSLLYYADELEYTQAALLADPTASAFVGLIQEQLLVWAEVFRAQRASLAATLQAEARVAVANTKLDAALRVFAARALAECGGDRGAPLFQRLFPRSPSSLASGPLLEEIQHVNNVILPELERLPEAHPLRASTALAAGAAETKAFLDERARARGARGVASGDEDDFKRAVNRTRALVHADLLRVAAEKGLGRDWVESFFRVASEDPAAKTEEPTA